MVSSGTEKAWLDTALRAARAGGRVLVRHFARGIHVDYKGEIDLVTAADREAEEAVIRTIRKDFPDHVFLAEESGDSSRGRPRVSPCRWIIDPLDGTTNFAHGFPAFCVSIGLEVGGEVVLGVVFNPVLKELFVGRQGHGATLNGKPLRVSATENLDRSLLVTGFAYNLREVTENNLDHFSDFTMRTQGIRRTGSAALDLGYVASGRFDGFWELYLNPWDTAAGLRIALEAGATVTDFSGNPFRIESKEIVASNGKIHGEMLEVLKTGNRERRNREQ